MRRCPCRRERVGGCACRRDATARTRARIARLMPACVVALTLAAPPLALQMSAQPLSPRNASYTIDATLDPSTRAITGSETIVWRNVSKTTATELQFHLYWNAWRSPRTTWMREAALGGNADDFLDYRENEWARIDVTSIKLTSPVAADLTGVQRFVTPAADAPASDGARHTDPPAHDSDDQTVMAVPLPQPVPPNSTATIEIQWTARVPRTFARTGAIGHFFFIAQWFPKLGVLEDTGWNCH